MLIFTILRISIITSVYLMTISANAFAQDMIITTGTDTILCKILRLDKEFISYNFPDSNLNKEFTIARYKTQKVFYANKLIENNTAKAHKYILFKQPDWRVDIGFGYAYFLETAFDQFGPDYANFFEPLRNGKSLYAEVSKFPDIRFGGGLEFQYGHYHHSEENILVFDTSLVFLGKGAVEETAQIFYLQPKGFYAVFSSTWDFVAGGGINFAHLNRTIDVLGERHRYSGESIGIGLSASIDRKISSSFSFGLRSSVGLVLLSTIRQDGQLIELNEENYFSASQFSLSLGLKYLY